MKTHYEVLGVGESASPDEIRAAYRAQIRKFHPDVYEGPAEEATERAIELNGAWAVLSDPKRRGLYDRMLHPHPQAPETPQKAPREPPRTRINESGSGRPAGAKPVIKLLNLDSRRSSDGWEAYTRKRNGRSAKEEETAVTQVLFAYDLLALGISWFALMVVLPQRVSLKDAATVSALALGGHGLLGGISLKWLSEGSDWMAALGGLYLFVSCFIILGLL